MSLEKLKQKSAADNKSPQPQSQPQPQPQPQPKDPAPRKKRALPLFVTGSLFANTLEVDNEEAVEMLRTMYRIRHFQNSVFDLAEKTPAPDDLPHFAGDEALAVGACAALKSDDVVCVAQNGLGPCIAWNADMNLLAEKTRTAADRRQSAGQGLSSSASGRMDYPPRIILGGDMTIATGAALACKNKKNNRIVLCFFDEDSAAQNAFHEALSLALLWELPIVFLCENRQEPGKNTRSRKNAVQSGGILARAQALGMHAIKCDGTRVLDVRETMLGLCHRARGGMGPALAEATIWRMPRAEESQFVNGSPITDWRKRDPVDQFKILLFEAGALTAGEADALELKVIDEVGAHFKQKT